MGKFKKLSILIYFHLGKKKYILYLSSEQGKDRAGQGYAVLKSTSEFCLESPSFINPKRQGLAKWTLWINLPYKWKSKQGAGKLETKAMSVLYQMGHQSRIPLK